MQGTAEEAINRILFLYSNLDVTVDPGPVVDGPQLATTFLHTILRTHTYIARK